MGQPFQVVYRKILEISMNMMKYAHKLCDSQILREKFRMLYLSMAFVSNHLNNTLNKKK